MRELEKGGGENYANHTEWCGLEEKEKYRYIFLVMLSTSHFPPNSNIIRLQDVAQIRGRMHTCISNVSSLLKHISFLQESRGSHPKCCSTALFKVEYSSYSTSTFPV